LGYITADVSRDVGRDDCDVGRDVRDVGCDVRDVGCDARDVGRRWQLLTWTATWPPLTARVGHFQLRRKKMEIFIVFLVKKSETFLKF